MARRSASRRAGVPAPSLLLAAALLLAGAPAARADSTGYQYYLDGSVAAGTRITQPGLLLAGGASDQDDAMGRLVAGAGYGNVVVLDAWGKDSYGPYLLGLGAASVQTFVFNNRSGAYEPALLEALRRADAIFFDGGNQWDYVHFWRDTPVEDLVSKAALTRPVGGISAGLAIQGKYVFTAEQGTITSDQALKDPYYSHLDLIDDFLALPNLGRVITDTHFVTRDRMGRAVTFLARIVQDGWAAQACAVAVEQGTTLWVEPTGHVRFYGAGGAYFLRTTRAPEVCRKGGPLTLKGVEVYRLADPSASFDLGAWTGKGGTAYTVSATAGVLSSSQPGGGIY